MKKILTILMFVAIFGMLMSSVSAADLHPHDFDGLFTLDVPSDKFSHVNAGECRYTDHENNIVIEYFTLDKMPGGTFESYIDSLGLTDVGTEDNLTIYQDGSDYVIPIYSDEELIIITDDDLEEAKAITSSANFGTNVTDETNAANDTTAEDNTTEASYNSSDVEMERVPVNEYMTIEAPKGCEFDNGTYDGFWVTYYGSNFNGIIYYTIDDAYYDELLNNVTSRQGVNSYAEGDVTIAEGILNIDGTNAGYVHGDNEMAIVISNDLNLVKEMAQTVEFT